MFVPDFLACSNPLGAIPQVFQPMCNVSANPEQLHCGVIASTFRKKQLCCTLTFLHVWEIQAVPGPSVFTVCEQWGSV